MDDLEPTPFEWRLVSMLAKYWFEHPLACDTSDGIRRWWLPDGLEVPFYVLATALAWMVAHSMAEASPGLDGRIRFRRGAEVDLARFQQLASMNPDACEGNGD